MCSRKAKITSRKRDMHIYEHTCTCARFQSACAKGDHLGWLWAYGWVRNQRNDAVHCNRRDDNACTCMYGCVCVCGNGVAKFSSSILVELFMNTFLTPSSAAAAQHSVREHTHRMFEIVEFRFGNTRSTMTTRAVCSITLLW